MARSDHNGDENHETVHDVDEEKDYDRDHRNWLSKIVAIDETVALRKPAIKSTISTKNWNSKYKDLTLMNSRQGHFCPPPCVESNVHLKMNDNGGDGADNDVIWQDLSDIMGSPLFSPTFNHSPARWSWEWW